MNRIMTVDELVKQYTLKELKEMFEQLYGISCYRRTKRDIASDIYYWHTENKRTEDLIKNLR